jgi:TPR repeat protein
MKLKLLFFSCIILFTSKLFAQDSGMDKGLMAFDAKNFKLALTELKPYAEKGNCLAQFAVGFSYSYGGDEIKNDSLAIHWLQLAADQKLPRAMGPLATSYFALNTSEARVKAYLWAELGAEYDPIQRGTTARVLIKMYLKPDELKQAESLIAEYKKNWKDKKDCY